MKKIDTHNDFAMIKKGQKIKIKIDGETVAKSTSCTLSITANTTDESTKDDVDALYDNPSVSYISWSCSNEGFIVDLPWLKSLLELFQAHEPVDVEVSDDKDVVTTTGKALITGITISAPNKENATVSISLQGDGMYV